MMRRVTADLVVLEGLHAVKHAVRFGAELVDVVTADAERLGVLARELAPDVAAELLARAREGRLEELTASAVPTGVVAIARRPSPDAARVLAAGGDGPVVLLDGARHLGNVGAAIRVAAAAGAAGLLTLGEADPWHPAAVRGAAGLQFALPVARLVDLATIDRPVVALDPGGAPLTPAAVPAGAVLAFGSERHGLSEAVRERADATLALPMRDGVSSLNLATAVAAVLYTLRLPSWPAC